MRERENKEKKKKMNKTSIKYMRGPWRGGNLPLIQREKKAKKNK